MTDFRSKEEFDREQEILKQKYFDLAANALKPEIEANHKPIIELPKGNRSVINFSYDVGNALKFEETIFYMPHVQKLVEIREHYDTIEKQNIVQFVDIDAKRMIGIICDKFLTLTTTYKFEREYTQIKSPSESIIKIMMASDAFCNQLPKIKRFFSFPMPFITNKSKLLFPEKGYNKDLQAHFTEDTPEIKIIDVSIAKKILHEILMDFCYKNPADKEMAIAFILTPACRGLYESITERTPFFLLTANRERAGKDYLAGVQGIIYENQAIDNSPVSDGTRNTNTDELRKQIASAIIGGRRRMHFANNKGKIDNSVLEQVLTSKTYMFRLLGKNETVKLSNEMDFSGSANIGLTYTADLWHRMRRIELFFSDEDPNNRTFTHPNLHLYVKQNRPKIISAICTLIKTWYEAGQPTGKTPFTSFPEWAKVVGGIMSYHNLGDPAQKLQDHNIGGDKESQDMKTLFEEMYELQTNGSDENAKGFKPSEIRLKIRDFQEDWSIFSDMDMDSNKDATKFGKLLPKYVGRIFSGIRMKVDNPEKRASRQVYSWGKVENE